MNDDRPQRQTSRAPPEPPTSFDTEHTIRELLNALTTSVRQRGDPMLEAALDLADLLAGEVETAHRTTEDAERKLSAALFQERTARQRLKSVLELLHELGDAELEVTSDAPTLDDSTPRRPLDPGPRSGITAGSPVELRQSPPPAGVDDPPPEPSTASAPPPQAERHDLEVTVLGEFSLTSHGEPVTTWSGHLSTVVFQYLVCHRNSPVHKEVLMELLWPGADPNSSRRNLHQAVYSLRQTLRALQPNAHHVIFQKDCYRLNPNLDLWVDAEEFEALVSTGRQLESSQQTTAAVLAFERADRLYRGDYLQDSPYDDWTIEERDRLASVYYDLAARLGSLYLTVGRMNDAMSLAHKTLSRDPCNEDATRLLMQCYASEGRRELAVRQFSCYEASVRRVLSIEPSDALKALLRSITA